MLCTADSWNGGVKMELLSDCEELLSDCGETHWISVQVTFRRLCGRQMRGSCQGRIKWCRGLYYVRLCVCFLNRWFSVQIKVIYTNVGHVWYNMLVLKFGNSAHLLVVKAADIFSKLLLLKNYKNSYINIWDVPISVGCN